MKNKKIKLVIDEKYIPITISEENEQLYIDAANNVNRLLNIYQKHYYSTPKDTIYAMVLCSLSIQNEEYRIKEKKYECEKCCPSRYIPPKESNTPKEYLEIIKRIKEFMQNNNLSIRDFAKKTGLSPVLLFWILNGEKKTALSISTICAIKKGFPKLQLDWLLGMENDSNKSTL